MVALESLALGKPVIAPDVGGLKELLLEGETGYLYPVDRQDVLCDLIMQMADGRSSLPGASGSKVSMPTLSRFRLETVIRQYLEIYQTVKPAVRDRNT
jgi:glycosyltransferase involved in cell wall biosynthesis